MIHHPAITEKLLKQMYLTEGMTAKEVADEMGISERYVRKLIKQFGLLKEELLPK